MTTGVPSGHHVCRAARRPARVIGLAALSMLALSTLLPISSVAQDTPLPTPSLHMRGPRVLRTLPPPGLIEPTPGEVSPHVHMTGIGIDGFPFLVDPRNPCLRSVANAIQAHDDLFTGDRACDDLIKQARAIQRQKEAEDPSYANEPRITPAPTATESDDDQNRR